MSISVTCPKCNSIAEVPDSAAGARGKCRACGSVVAVPKLVPRVAKSPPPSSHPTPSNVVATAAIAVPDTKACPYCGETIKLVAVKCRFCGEALNTPPASMPDANRLSATETVPSSIRSPELLARDGKVLFGCFLFCVAISLLSFSGALQTTGAHYGESDIGKNLLMGISGLVLLCVTPYGIWWGICYGGSAARLSRSGVLGLIGVFGLGLMLLIVIVGFAAAVFR